MAQMCPSCSRDNYDVAQACGYCRQPLRGLLGQNTVLAGRYQVTQVLGCGGMGAVYLAYDQRIQGRQVAVKENLDTTPLARNQFDAEVKVMAALRHPNLPGISDHFTGPNGRQYLVMDYIAGETLEDMVTQRGPLPEAEVVALTRQLLDALDYLHSNRVVHRDIKPSNIKRAPDGRLYLVDFGISKRQATGVVTQSWARGVGSPGFAPLEQYHGGTDGRSDIYSLGAVIYFLLTAQVPPDAPDLASGTLLQPPSRVKPGVSGDTDRLVLRAMATQPVAPLSDRRRDAAGVGCQTNDQPHSLVWATGQPAPANVWRCGGADSGGDSGCAGDYQRRQPVCHTGSGDASCAGRNRYTYCQRQRCSWRSGGAR
jgi:serine/threonine protein kinase